MGNQKMADLPQERCTEAVPLVDLWLEEEQSVKSGQTMEQVLSMPGINYSKHSQR